MIIYRTISVEVTIHMAWEETPEEGTSPRLWLGGRKDLSMEVVLELSLEGWLEALQMVKRRKTTPAGDTACANE